MRMDMVRTIISLAYENISTGAETLPEVKRVVATMSGLSMEERRFVAMACCDLNELGRWARRPVLHFASVASGAEAFPTRRMDRGRVRLARR